MGLKTSLTLSFAITVVQSSNWHILHQCPQCSATVDLQETTKVLSCEYCRTRLYLHCADYFRLVIEHNKLAHDAQLVYAPYWRLKGISFSMYDDLLMRQSVAEITLRGTNLSIFPQNLGFRAQTQRLKYAVPTEDALFLKSDIAFDNVSHTIADQLDMAEVLMHRGLCHLRTFITETISQIYAPYYLYKDTLYDAVSKAKVAEGCDLANLLKQSTNKLQWMIGFVSAICPHCGWDLQAQSDSVCLICKNCQSIWEPSSTGLQRLSFFSIRQREREAIALPFWRVTAEIDGLQLETYADFARFVNLPKAPQKKWADMQMRFWFPAFKVSPQLFLRLQYQCTIAQYEDNLLQALPENPYAITLSVAEVSSGIKSLLAHLAAKKRVVLSSISKLSINVKDYCLIYLPFKEGVMDISCSALGITIHKNALKRERFI